MVKYNLRYTTKAELGTKDKKFQRRVQYFNSNNMCIGSTLVIYNSETKNHIEVYDENGVRLEADVADATEARQFLIDRYEYALQQSSKEFSKRVFNYEKIKAAIQRLKSINFGDLQEDFNFLVGCFGEI